MKRTAALALTVVTAAAMSMAATAAPSLAATRVQLEKTSVGKVLVNGRGFTLYLFTKDKRNHDSCARIQGCLSVWPMLATHGSTIAGPGVKRSLLGSIRLSNGKRQVTYAGHPLYMYAFDTAPRSATYVGVSQFSGRWYAVSSNGTAVK